MCKATRNSHQIMKKAGKEKLLKKTRTKYSIITTKISITEKKKILIILKSMEKVKVNQKQRTELMRNNSFSKDKSTKRKIELT